MKGSLLRLPFLCRIIILKKIGILYEFTGYLYFMSKNSSLSFSAKLEIIGINPFVFLPEEVLLKIFNRAGKEKGAIPVKGSVNGKAYKQNLVKYSSAWRLYINMGMLKDSPQRIGETIHITIDYDSEERKIPLHPGLEKAFQKNKAAKAKFDTLSPSRQKEIIRYIANLKSEESVKRNIRRAIDHLAGKTSFAGREKS